MRKLRPIFREFLSCLVSERVRFVIVGAHALGAAGRPRYTDDLDVLIEPTVSNARRTAAALRAFGFSPPRQYLKLLATPDNMLRYGGGSDAIDILTSISAVSFREAWRGRVKCDIGGFSVSFLGEKELIKSKRAAGRTKDLLDLALLDERPKKR